MRRTVFIVFGCLLAAATHAWGQDADTSFVGVVTGESVYVRSGAGRTYYSVATLNKGELVSVRDADALYGYYAIDPVKGAACLISKQYVRVGEDGIVGTLTGNRVRVRIENAGEKPDDMSFTSFHYRSPVRLNAGDTVRVIGENEDYYRILPPRGVTHYISAEFVLPATAAQIRAAEQRDSAEQATESAEAVEEETQTATSEDAGRLLINTAADVTDATVEVAGDVVEGTGDLAAGAVDTAVEITERAVDAVTGDEETAEAVDAAEMAEALDETEEEVVVAHAEEEHTVTEAVAVEATEDAVAEEVATAETEAATTGDVDRQLAALEARYAEESEKPLGEQDVAGLLAAYEALAADETLSDSQRMVVSGRVDVLTDRVGHQETTEGGGADKQYTAVGKLLASMIYTGGETPLLYRLVDPLTGLTIGYVEPGSRRKLNPYLGQVVGVVGRTRYDAALRLKVIELKSIDRLTAAQ